MDEQQKEYLENALQSLCTLYEEGARLKSLDLLSVLENSIETVKIVAKNNKLTFNNETDNALKKYFVLKGFFKLPSEQQQRLMQHIEGDGSLIKGLF